MHPALFVPKKAFARVSQPVNEARTSKDTADSGFIHKNVNSQPCSIAVKHFAEGITPALGVLPP